MNRHLVLVSTLFIALGFVGLLATGIVFIAITGGGAITGDPFVMSITTTVAVVLSALLLAFSLPAIVGGIATLSGRPWGRTMLTIVSAMHLVNLPIGTALGIYGLWVLTTPEPRSVEVATAAAAPSL